jgi:Uma2 family endonuclease
MLSMSQPARRLPTFEELYRQIEALPEGVTGLILEPGVLTTMSLPALPHQWTLQQVVRDVARYGANLGGQGWWIFTEVEIRFPLDLLAVPDVSGWRVERVPKMPRDNPLCLLPDWACEVLSPGTATDDRLRKLPLYARAGVRWVWLVDPELRSVEVYESIDGKASLIGGARNDEAAALAPFEEPFALPGWWMPA